MALKGKNLWDELKGKKAELKDIANINLGGVEGEVTVQFVDADVLDLVDKEVNDKLPKKPIIQIPAPNGGMQNIEVPNDDPKYQKFNDHQKAKQWKKKAKPYEVEKLYRLAYEFIAEDERPSDDPDEGTKILRDRLRFVDANKIIEKGMKLSGFSERLEEAKNES